MPGPFVAFGQHQVGPVDLVAGGGEVLADRAEGGAPAGAVVHEPGGLRAVRVGAGAGVDAQLGLERRGDLPGADEADQAPGEDGWLRPGGQPDGQPPGGDVIDGAALGIGGGDAVADETLVQGQVGQQPVLRQPAGVSGAGICHRLVRGAFPGRRETRHRCPAGVRAASVPGTAGGSGVLIRRRSRGIAGGAGG